MYILEKVKGMDVLFSFRRIPVLGKHNKRIVTAAWGLDNSLALGSEDKTVTISNSQGDTLKTIQIHGTPSALQFCGEYGLDEAKNTVGTLFYFL